MHSSVLFQSIKNPQFPPLSDPNAAKPPETHDPQPFLPPLCPGQPAARRSASRRRGTYGCINQARGGGLLHTHTLIESIKSRGQGAAGWPAMLPPRASKSAQRVCPGPPETYIAAPRAVSVPGCNGSASRNSSKGSAGCFRLGHADILIASSLLGLPGLLSWIPGYLWMSAGFCWLWTALIESVAWHRFLAFTQLGLYVSVLKLKIRLRTNHTRIHSLWWDVSTYFRRAIPT